MQYRINKIDKDFDGIIFFDDNTAIKVPFTIEGELVNIKKIDKTNSTAIATDFEIIEKSKNRVHPICKYFTKCGGCKAQHFSKQAYLDQKVANLKHLLSINKIDYYEEIKILHHYDDQKGYRRRAIFSVDGKKIGFKEYKSNKIVDIDYCAISTENINKTLKFLRAIILKHNYLLKIIDITITDINESIDIFIKAKSKINKNVIEAFKEIFSLANIKKITWNNEPLIIKEEISLNYGKYKIPFSSGGFLQAEKFAEDFFNKFVIDNLKSSKKILDLFCGFGGYSFSILNEKDVEQISLFDISNEAIKSIKKHESTKIKAETRDLFKNPLPVSYLNNFDTVIINPPRGGAIAQIKEISKSNVQKIIMIYCSATTFARDVALLIEGKNFNGLNITVVDQFIYSPHIEVLICLDKK